ncbi:hypothetical protein DKL58_01805 [Lactobacillus kullabergensis]|uniref:CopG family transcriptional regulator n=1 Tax=Lactobacillus kullabergensis TaxID=1218493 RepID=A0ABM6VYR7_9LACO|nr:hypothetical protein DKL58_01805 [Lactobacillus kullabergensis]
MAIIIKPNHRETENKTIRFPPNLIKEIKQAIKGNGVTFSAFVIQAYRYALNNMKQTKKNNDYSHILHLAFYFAIYFIVQKTLR